MTLLAAAAAAAAKAAPAAAKGAPLKITPQQLQAAAQPLQPPPPQTFVQAHAAWLTHGIAGIFIIAAIALIALLAVQTTKQEGLSGTIGGRVESAYSRMGAEEQLKRVTGFTAVVFVLCGFILSLTGI
ncbi:MAG TPA: preprotein translocase subunit SecG [Candidatus Acidoferrales bacterium]|nr:preprotein translocase subunit SecG [Candidatus Acidoferrales bacterium]